MDKDKLIDLGISVKAAGRLILMNMKSIPGGDAYEYIGSMFAIEWLRQAIDAFETYQNADDAVVDVRPDAVDIKQFLDVFQALSSFETAQRHVRGYGAFGPDHPMPDPAVVRVIAWLAKLAGEHAS